ncbi:hypothetical protein FCV25MIE_29421, partial [Fagus crenata]
KPINLTTIPHVPLTIPLPPLYTLPHNTRDLSIPSRNYQPNRSVPNTPHLPNKSPTPLPPQSIHLLNTDNTPTPSDSLILINLSPTVNGALFYNHSGPTNSISLPEAHNLITNLNSLGLTPSHTKPRPIPHPSYSSKSASIHKEDEVTLFG